MTTTEWKIARANTIMRQFRIEDKARDNQAKPTLLSCWVRQTKEYTFGSIMPHGDIGDSGPLLLAKKQIRSQRAISSQAFFCRLRGK